MVKYVDNFGEYGNEQDLLYCGHCFTIYTIKNWFTLYKTKCPKCKERNITFVTEYSDPLVDRQKKIEYFKRWKKNNKEKVRNLARKHYKRNIKKSRKYIREYMREYLKDKKNYKKAMERCKAYNQKPEAKEKRKKYASRWRKNNPDYFKKYYRNKGKK